MNNVLFRNYVTTEAVYESAMCKENNQYGNVLCQQKNNSAVSRKILMPDK